MAAPNGRGGSGRKKRVIRRIEQEDARHISYSKRRLGLFSKATNLAVLTGAQVAALAFSPGGKAFSFGHPSVDSVVDRFLAGEGARAGAREQGAAGEDEKLEKLQQEFDELRTELDEAKKLKKLHEEVMAKERAAGDTIAAWVDPKVRDMGDEDMAAFFAALMQVKDAVSERANQVLCEAMHLDASRMAPLLPPQLFGGSTFEFGSSSGSSNSGMEIQLPQWQGFEAGIDVLQMMELPPAQEVASGIETQQQMMELPPAQVVAATMDIQEMPPPPGFAPGMDIPQPPGLDDDMWMDIQQLLMEMPPSPEDPAGMETNAGFQFPY